MKQLYRAFEVESQKLGEAFHELVRRRHRDLGLPVPPEERVLPFRSQPSVSRAALDLLIDQDGDPDETPLVQTLAVLRTERRLEELDVLLDSGGMSSENRALATSHRKRLEDAFAQELRQYEHLARPPSQTALTHDAPDE